MRDGASLPNLRRNPGLDALRTFAILGMTAAHTSRLIVFESREAWSYWVLLLEPLIPSLFLFLVGISLTYSIAKSENSRVWYARQTRRAMILWLIAALFSGLEYGIRMPDVLFASGILCTIAYCILVIGAVLLLPRASWILALILSLGTWGFIRLDVMNSHAFPWISGNSPPLPLTLFAIAGALWGLWMRRFPRVTNWIWPLMLLAVIGILRHYGIHALFTYPLGRSDATRLLAAPITGGTAKLMGYYNLRPLLSLFCLCVHLGLLGFACTVLARMKETWAGRLFILGRHSLEIYILHLSLLAVLVVSFGLRPLKTAWQGNIVILAVILICLLWCFLREKRKALYP